MICNKLYHTNYAFPKSVVSQIYTPLPELLKKLEVGQLSKDDLQFNTQCYEFEENSEADMIKDCSSAIDILELASHSEAQDIVNNPSAVEVETPPAE